MNKRGSVLVVTLLLVVILATLGAALFLTGVNESFVLRRNVLSAQAFWVAEAGMHQAVWAIKSNNCYGMTNVETGYGCQVCNACGKGLLGLTGTVPQGEYSVSYDPVEKVIVSDGGVPSLKEPQARRQLKVLSKKKQLFGLGAFAGSLETPVRSMYEVPGSPAAATPTKSAVTPEPGAFDPYDWQQVQ